MAGPGSGGRCGCKVGRQRERYELEGLNDELLERRRREEMSLRRLADFVNVRVLEAAIDASDADVAGDPQSVYETLARDDVSPENRADLTDQLEFVGIDVEGVQDDFVSHQTIKHHLNDCLEVDTSRDGIESIDAARGRIEWSADRHRTVLENTVEQLSRAELVSVGEFEITQTTSITCTDCGASYRLEEFLNGQRCDCDR